MTDKTPLPKVGDVMRILINDQPTGKFQVVTEVDEKAGTFKLGPIRNEKDNR